MPTTLRGRSVLLAAVVGVLTALSPWAASAHSALISSNPTQGSTVSRMPEQVELKFNEDVSGISPAVILRSGGETVAELEPVIDGRVVTAAAPQDLPNGSYQLVWRVVSADGHPVDGVVPFSLGGDVEPAAAAPDRPTAPEVENSSTLVGLAIAAPVLLLVALAVTFVRRRRTSTHSHEGTTP